jgi:hypothetical protein
VNLVHARKVAKLKALIGEADTFKSLALEWFGKHESRWSTHSCRRRQPITAGFGGGRPRMVYTSSGLRLPCSTRGNSNCSRSA